MRSDLADHGLSGKLYSSDPMLAGDSGCFYSYESYMLHFAQSVSHSRTQTFGCNGKQGERYPL